MRHGYLEEAYFTYSYSPIRDETGGVAGVFASIYLFNAENAEGVARRAAFFGMIDDPRIVPAELDPDRDDQPLWAVLSSAPAQRSRVLTGLAADYPGLFTPTGGPMGDAAPDATPAGEVTVTLRDSGDGGVELVVSDTGVGIP